jgi:hypothetical protein
MQQEAAEIIEEARKIKRPIHKWRIAPPANNGLPFNTSTPPMPESNYTTGKVAGIRTITQGRFKYRNLLVSMMRYEEMVKRAEKLANKCDDTFLASLPSPLKDMVQRHNQKVAFSTTPADEQRMEYEKQAPLTTQQMNQMLDAYYYLSASTDDDDPLNTEAANLLTQYKNHGFQVKVSSRVVGISDKDLGRIKKVRSLLTKLKAKGLYHYALQA